ncbi:MAG: hypothetical protein OHK0053_07300 [Microscillaceae bacterium]
MPNFEQAIPYRFYWQIHLVSWYGLVLGNEILGLASLGPLLGQDVGAVFISISLAALFSHLYRKFLQAVGIFSQASPRRVAGSFVLGAVALPTLVTGVDTWLEWWIFKLDYFNWVDFASLALNVGRYLMMWLLLYYFFKMGQQRLQQTYEKVQNEKKIAELQTSVTKLRLGGEIWPALFDSIEDAMPEKPLVARQKITDLSEILRQMLHENKNDWNLLDSEWQLAQKWWDLARQRFEDDFSLRFVQSENMGKWKLLRHSLLMSLGFILRQQPNSQRGIDLCIFPEMPALGILFQSTAPVFLHFEQEAGLQHLRAFGQNQDANAYLLQLQMPQDQHYQLLIPLKDSAIP